MPKPGAPGLPAHAEGGAGEAGLPWPLLCLGPACGVTWQNPEQGCAPSSGQAASVQWTRTRAQTHTCCTSAQVSQAVAVGSQRGKVPAPQVAQPWGMECCVTELRAPFPRLQSLNCFLHFHPSHPGLKLTSLRWYVYAFVCQAGFPDSSLGRESACNEGDLGSIPGLGRSPGEGKGYPLQYSGLENSMDYIFNGVTKSRT